jgi:MoxR-like ATPase
MLTVRARALLQGRLAPDLSDVIAMAKPVLKHRMALNFAALARGESLDGLIEAEIAKSARLKDVA